MKINAEKILLDSNFDLKDNMFFVSGNEETMISKIKLFLIKRLTQKNFNETEVTENKKFNNQTENNYNGSLFSSKKILVHKNPIIDDINNLVKSDADALIVINTNSKKNIKIKKEFELSKNFYSINCYETSKPFKKRFFDFFINKNKLKLSKEAYWFFLDHSDNKFLIFENELKKLIDFQKEEITLNEVKLLMSKGDFQKAELLFFSILSKPNDIIETTRDVLGTQSDNYYFLQRTKFFIEIFLKAKNESDLISLFPKYLFNEKEKIKKIFNKINKKKIIMMLTLIKKTELLFRLHSNMQFIISQRFLLNLRKIIK